MKNFVYLLLFGFVMFVGVTSCDDDPKPDINELNYSLLKTALLERNEAVLKTEINAYFSKLNPNPTPTDESGYEEHFQSFARTLDKSEDLTVVTASYESISTLPPKSSIILTISPPKDEELDKTLKFERELIFMPKIDGNEKVTGFAFLGLLQDYSDESK